MKNFVKTEDPPTYTTARSCFRQRFRKIPPGIYENIGTGKVIVIISESEYYLGHIRIRNNKYRYASWRQGKKIKEKYLGAVLKSKV